MNYIDIEGEDPIRFGIEISIAGIFQTQTGIEGSGYMTHEYSYNEVVEPFHLTINGHSVELPKELRQSIEESIMSYLE